MDSQNNLNGIKDNTHKNITKASNNNSSKSDNPNSDSNISHNICSSNQSDNINNNNNSNKIDNNSTNNNTQISGNDYKKGKLNDKRFATIVSIVVAIFLATIKTIVGILSGSLAILSSAVDSILDLLSSTINYFAIKKADAPADYNHSFGHHKFEILAAFIQSIIITFSGIAILVSVYSKSKNKDYFIDISFTAISVMVVSLITTISLVIYLKRKAKEYNSLALEADSIHYTTDILSNFAILAALIVIKFTNIYIIDSIFAVITAIYVISSAIHLSIKAANDLVDKNISDEDYAILTNILKIYEDKGMHFENLRTRSAGAKKFINMHIVMCGKLSLEDAHKIIDEIELNIKQSISNTDILIHPEPCDDNNCNHNPICHYAK